MAALRPSFRTFSLLSFHRYMGTLNLGTSCLQFSSSFMEKGEREEFIVSEFTTVNFPSETDSTVVRTSIRYQSIPITSALPCTFKSSTTLLFLLPAKLLGNIQFIIYITKRILHCLLVKRSSF